MKAAYQQTLDFLYSQLPMFHRIGAAAFRKDLTNTLALMDFLEHPHRHYPCIHVGGTNGKGSTAHMLAAILQARGLKTGLYISPHYRDFRERIKVNGKYVARQFVIDFIEQMKPLIEKIQPSFFELTVGMAFEYFKQQKVDVAIIEVGMGGRLDSTNVINPVLSVITNIGWDHMQFLGDTLPLIASEKAGIIKAGIPVVIGETQPETAPVFKQKASEMEAEITFADQHYSAILQAEDFEKSIFEVSKDGLSNQPYALQAHGPFQRKNLCTVLQAVEKMPVDWGIKPEHVHTGLAELRSRTRFMGRWQFLQQAPRVLCDSAHNEDGLREVMERLLQLDFSQLHIVMGVVRDKDLGKMLDLFPKNANYYFAKPDIPRGLEAKDLQAQAQGKGLLGKTYTSVRNALKAAKRHSQPDDLIYVGGSTFVVAEVI
jgi:dihydrofolate synthase / folylpolyglutamate synthase